MKHGESDQDLISVIVPVYNVEAYLPRCIDSILSQNYPCLEIILVDDGSTDQSGLICDEYEKKDSRIKVIHQINGGLSCARNRGIQKATGPLIGLVDSDDYIDSNMYRLLYHHLKKNRADIAICSYYEVQDDQMQVPYCLDETVIYTRQEAIQSLVSEQTFKNYAWNKLYKKELFSGIQYPEGHNMEDLATTYKIFEKADRIVCLNQVLYYYSINRPGSILSEINLKTQYDLFVFHRQRYDDLKDRYPSLKGLLFSYIIGAALTFCAKYRVKRDVNSAHQCQLILQYLKKHKQQISQNLSITDLTKLRTRILLCHIKLLHVFDFLINCLRKSRLHHPHGSGNQLVTHFEKNSDDISARM